MFGDIQSVAIDLWLTLVVARIVLGLWLGRDTLGPHTLTLRVIVSAVMIPVSGLILPILGIGELWADCLAAYAWVMLCLIDVSHRFGGLLDFEKRKQFITWYLRLLPLHAALTLGFAWLSAARGHVP